MPPYLDPVVEVALQAVLERDDSPLDRLVGDGHLQQPLVDELVVVGGVLLARMVDVHLER